jgi:hypothetical protein
MKSIAKILPVIVLILVFAFKTDASNSYSLADTNKHASNYAISIVPSFTLQNGFRFDLDIHLKNNHWLVIGPHYWVARNQNMGMFYGLNQPTDLDGYGFDLYHKVLLKNQVTTNGPYFAYGVRYDHLTFKYKDYDWVDKVDGWGTHYYEWSEKEFTEINNRYGFNLMFGLQYAVNNKLLIDGYTGCGFQVSDVSPEDSKSTDFSNFFLRYNYSGPRFLLGIRIGLFLF